MNKINNKKNLFKKVSLFICFILLVAFINVNLKNASAVDSTLPIEPTFDIKMNPVTPNPAMVGEDINVSGVITPKPFESDIPKKQIVLVLDVSYSMYENNKMGKLKTAAYNFIEIMRQNQVSNLEVAIVTYASTSTIKTNLNNNNFISISNYSYLQNIINNLNYETRSGLYYTNMGEGLRKAEYLLENGDQNASKSIIFMSDGVPNYYSRISTSNNNFYMSIDNSNPSYTGDNSGNLDTKAKNYATQMGNKIRDTKKPNVFSIGYGLGNATSQSNLTMQDIHKSMGGSTTDGSFFATDVGAIDAVFNSIANKIIRSYTITNVKINLNLDSNFTLNIGGNTVNINNIVYTLTSQSNGKYIYTAPSIDFSFTIKGKVPNVYENIFQSSQLAVPWNSVTKTTNIPKTGVTVKSSGLPDIGAKMDRLSSEPYEVEKPINVTYKITPNPFTFQSTNGSSTPKDVVILLDVSSAMNGKLDAVKQAISNKLLHDNELQTCKTRYSIITFSDSAIYNKLNENDTETIQKCNSESNYSDLVKQKILDTISVSNSNNRNMTNALVLAQNILDNGRNEPATNTIDVNRGTGSKNIIIIGGGSITDQGSSSLTTQINNIKSKNYNIITFNVGQVVSQNEEPNNNLKDFYYSLIGKQGSSSENISEKENNNYYINVDYRKFDANNPHSLFLDSNNINSNNTIEDPVMLRIANKLKGGVKQSYTFKAKLKFNKGDKFDIVSGLTTCSDGNYNVETNEFNVVYTLKNGAYSADSFDISFQIKPNQTGTSEFGRPGIISYTNLENKLTGNPIEPFSIMVGSPVRILQHGLYEGVKDGAPSIDERGSFNFVKGSNIQLGATLFGSISSNSEGVKLDVPKEIEPIGTIKVFIYDDSGNLTQVGTMAKSSSSDAVRTTYIYTGTDITNQKILILYNQKIPDNPQELSYVNKLYAPENEQDVTLRITDKLPELF